MLLICSCDKIKLMYTKKHPVRCFMYYQLINLKVIHTNYGIILHVYLIR